VTHRPRGFILGSGATVTVRSGSGTNIQTDLYWGRTQHVWNNDGDAAHLRDTG
jgi:competence protein ComEC